MIGKTARFVMLGFKIGKEFSLSSKIEDIGVIWDIVIKNYTQVTILGEPIKVLSPKHGVLEVIHVMADGIACWALTETIVEIKDIEIWN